MVSQRREGHRQSAVGARCLTILFVASTLTGCAGDERWAQFRQVAKHPFVYDSETALHQGLNREPLRPLPPVAEGVQEEARVVLGRSLFHDTRLSADGSVSCASCHDLSSGGDDGRRVSIGVGGASGQMNAPTVLNSGGNFRQFWDGRLGSLEEQAVAPVTNPAEMAGDWTRILEDLSNDTAFMQRFESAFGHDEPQVEHIADAIAAFERTLVTPSPFDDYLGGQADAVSEEAIAGYALFKRYGCVACHQGINVGGNLMHYFGAFHSVRHQGSQTEDRQVVVRAAAHAAARHDKPSEDTPEIPLYKVPSLRNVALTAPYFHTGTVDRLDDAVRVMAAVQLGRRLPERDVELIVTFLESLTGRLSSASRLADRSGS